MAEMTINDYFSPMTETRRVVFLTFDMAEILDLTGPASVFSTANQLSGAPLYKVVYASPAGGAIIHSCGAQLETCNASRLRFTPADTMIVVGAYAERLSAALKNAKLEKTVTRAAAKAARIGSVCTGAFLLANAGLLNGRRATTHWAAARMLGDGFPSISVIADALYIVDEGVWTSAGVATGIDMALAMLEEDYGRRIKSAVAKQLVVYAHRPGHQSQFSDLLIAQGDADAPFAALIEWLHSQLDQPVKVAEMANYVGMSERTFFRRFKDAFGMAPSRLFENLRLEKAHTAIHAGESIKAAAHKAGFQSQAAFRTAFKTRFGIPPSHSGRMSR